MNDILPEFQKFIAQRKLAPENQIPFYAYWVSKFLRFSNTRQDKSLDLSVQMFLDALKKDKKLLDWEIQGAEIGIRRHSALGYVSPVDFRKLSMATYLCAYFLGERAHLIPRVIKR
ncbi:MAG: hypothetical protein JRD69_04565 [Deltaproteobacteria bacterium]|nr:hypothetical protein [Deltaproteobacteria bacterium]